MIDITPIMEAIITLVFLCITTFLIPYIKSKTTSAQQEQIQAWVNIAVMAAEQLIQGSGMGAEKKKYVIKWLNEHNITFDAEKLDAMIEAAVYKLTNNPTSIEIPVEISNKIEPETLVAAKAILDEKTAAAKKNTKTKSTKTNAGTSENTSEANTEENK